MEVRYQVQVLYYSMVVNVYIQSKVDLHEELGPVPEPPGLLKVKESSV